MTTLEILLIVIGIGIIIFSCFLVDKSTPKSENFTQLDVKASKNELTIEEIEQIRMKIDTIITEMSEETIIKTDDKLSQITNEKIIAVHDYSNQIIEKINQNHEEVVFLYNMLNEKENELKDTMKQLDHSKKQFSEIKPKESTEPTKKNSVNIVLTELDQSKQNTNRLLEEMGDNNNEKILNYHSQGKSIIEISKLLGLGQGEVKLVIDLFKEK